jgi:hypothetical protein
MINGMIRTLRAIALSLVLAAPSLLAQETRFEVSFAASAHAAPLTGRVFVALAKAQSPEPIRQIGSYTGRTPFFAADIDRLAAGRAVTIDASSAGFPAHSLKELPAGDYYAQAIANVYTQFHRADGHVIWAHMDQWEGQNFTRSPATTSRWNLPG